MSSRVFKAKAGHTADKPQICGLSDKKIAKGDWIMYLVCHGADARPEYQIKVTREEKKTVKFRGRSKTVSEKDYGMDNGRKFRSVFGGWQRNDDTGKREKVFSWQEHKGKDADGEDIWMPVKCWSHIVLADIADGLGYEVRKNGKGKWRTTTAHDGDRAIGNEHTVDAEGENAMEVLARAACSDEELGLVPPKAESEIDQIIREENEAISQAMNAEMAAEAALLDEMEDAKALGMTLAQYRRLVAERG
jgi:hypothetical protein